MNFVANVNCGFSLVKKSNVFFYELPVFGNFTKTIKNYGT
jgi:hypothetical protein